MQISTRQSVTPFSRQIKTAASCYQKTEFIRKAIVNAF
jgi:hypothetical protein